MKGRITFLALTAYLLLMFPLTVFADIIYDEPPPVNTETTAIIDNQSLANTDTTAVPPIAIIILVAILAISTMLIIRRLKKTSRDNVQ